MEGARNRAAPRYRLRFGHPWPLWNKYLQPKPCRARTPNTGECSLADTAPRRQFCPRPPLEPPPPPEVSGLLRRFPYHGRPPSRRSSAGLQLALVLRHCLQFPCTGRLASLSEPPRILRCGLRYRREHRLPGASQPRGRNSGDRHQRRSPGRGPANACDAPALVMWPPDLRIEQRKAAGSGGGRPFDLINSVGVLHHLREPGAGLLALAGLLKPGGLPAPFFCKMQKAVFRLGDPPHPAGNAGPGCG